MTNTLRGLETDAVERIHAEHPPPVSVIAASEHHVCSAQDVQARELLGQIGHASAVEPLKALLNDENPDVAEIAKEALEEIEND